MRSGARRGKTSPIRGIRIFAAGLAVTASLAALLACRGEDPLERIRALQADGEFEQTLDDLHSILAKDPDHPEANYRLGLALLNTGRPSQAFFPLRKAAASDAFAIDAGLVLGTTLSQTENHEEALAALDGVLEREPANQTALLIRTQSALAIHRGHVALESAERLLQIEPGRAPWKLLRAGALAQLDRFEAAEALYRELVEAPWEEDPLGPARACLQLARFHHTAREDADRAASTLDECVDRFPDTPLVALGAAELYDEMEREESAVAVLREALERNPEALALRQALGQRLVAGDHFEEADALLSEQALSQGDAESWNAVAMVRRQAGDLEGALDAVDRALASAQEPNEERLLLRIDTLVDLGRLEEAEAELQRLEEPLYIEVAEGRLAHVRGDPTRALELYSEALQYWPHNYGLRVHTALAALDADDLKRAMAELLEASRHAPRETDAALWLARLHFAEGDYASAVAFALRHVQQRGTTGPAAHLLVANAEFARRNTEAGLQALADLASRRDGEYAAVALSETARFTAKAGRPELAVEALERATRERDMDLADPRNQAVLLQLSQLLVDLGRLDEALERSERLLARRPDSPSLLAVRGRLLLAAGRPQEAEESFTRTLELDPENAAAMAGRALRRHGEGDLDGAIEWMGRAASSEPGNPDYAYMAARMTTDRGDPEAGLRQLKALLRIHPDYAPAANDLAWQLAVDGADLERAERLAERALRLSPSAEVLDTLGFVKLRRGALDDAIRAFEGALERQPAYGTARYHLAMAMLEKGDRKAARSALRTALEGAFPEAAEARRALQRLEGEVTP